MGGWGGGGLLEVAFHLDQREANMQIERTCETLYLVRLVVIVSNDRLFSLFTSMSSIPSLLISSGCCIYDSIPVSSSLVCTTEDLKACSASFFSLLFDSKEKKNADFNNVSSPLYYNTNMHVCCFNREKKKWVKTACAVFLSTGFV